MKRDHIINQSPFPPLPSGYRRLEYLEGTGTQYILAPGNITTSYTINTEFYINSDSSTCGIFCWGKDSNRIMFIWNDGTSYHYCTGSGYKVLSVASQHASKEAWHQMTVNYNNVNIDGTNYSLVGQSNVTTNLPLKIFALDFSNSQNSPTNFMKGKIKNLTITNNNTIIYDYIPALRTSDNKPGLYDVINGVFYTNAGTGEFNYA